MLAGQYPNSQHMPYPDLFASCLLNTTVGFSRVEGFNSVNLYIFQITFYQAANTTKYVKKSNFNRLLEILALEILKSKQLRPHMYAALTHVSAEYFTDLQQEISRNLECSEKLMGLQKRTRANYIEVFGIPNRTHVTEKVPIPGINFLILRNISGTGTTIFFQYQHSLPSQNQLANQRFCKGN